MSATTRSAPVPFTSFSCRAAAASPDATSPARAPPIPSAIANSGGSHTNASSFSLRFRPGWVATALLATLMTGTHSRGCFRAKCCAFRATGPGRRACGERAQGVPVARLVPSQNVRGQRAKAALSAGCCVSIDVPMKARLGRADVHAGRSSCPRQPPKGHARGARLSGLVARNAQHSERSGRGARSDSSLVPQICLAYANDVSRGELLRAREAGAVQVRAVGRADVLDPDAVAARLDACVPAGGEFVVHESDVVGGRAPDGDRLRVEVEPRTLLERARADGDERARVDRLRLPAQAGRRRLLRAHDEALLRHAHVA